MYRLAAPDRGAEGRPRARPGELPERQVRLYTSLSLSLSLSLHIYIYICIYIYTYMYIHMYVCIHTSPY